MHPSIMKRSNLHHQAPYLWPNAKEQAGPWHFVRRMGMCGLLLFAAIQPMTTQAQKLKARLAEEAAAMFDYPRMAAIYEDITTSSKGTPDDYRRLAFAYKRMGQYLKAEAAYKQMANMGPLNPPDMLDYADVLRTNGHYAEALMVYEAYASTHPDDQRVQGYLEQGDFFMRLKRDSTRNEVRAVPINSPQADLGMTVMDDLLIFSSARGEGVGGKNQYKWDDQPFLNLYTALLKGRTAAEPMVMRKELNSRYHDGTASYDSIAHRLYFTRDNVFYGTLNKASNGELKLGIFTSDITAGEFNQREWDGLVPFEHNDPEFNTGHPAISPEGKRLYFASDRPGGVGGTDIWFCDNLGNRWGVPQNMGPKVNTTGNEMFPYLSQDSILYFTSNAQPGLGGYDIFQCRLTPKGPSSVINVGYPINTRFDERNLILLQDDTSGFFVSNRPGGLGSDDIYGCTVHPPMERIVGRVVDSQTREGLDGALLDIKDGNGRYLDDARITMLGDGRFQIEAPYRNAYNVTATKNGYLQNSVALDPDTDALDDVTISLQKYDYGAEGSVMHGETRAPLAGAKVLLLDANDKLLQEAVTGPDGQYAFSLAPNTDYRLKVEKEGFFKQSARISTKGRTATVIRTDFKLFPLEVDQVVRLDNIYYDLAKWSIRPDAALELDKLVQTLVDNPSVKIELSAHTDCRGKDAYNMDLSSKRAKSAVDHLIKQGIAKDRLISKGYGETKPVEACECTKCNEEQHQRNRRTEFKVLSK
jgi:outer membrane protein OmpA-like peptidoglycan-associated protein/tetratricopeptide (TPR) repeat protein